MLARTLAYGHIVVARRAKSPTSTTGSMALARFIPTYPTIYYLLTRIITQ